MSLLTLNSKNPNFSFVIQKRPYDNTPATMPMMTKSLREGTIFGFYPVGKEDTYVIHFRDGFDEVSFKKDQDEEFEYLNITRYNSSMFLSYAIKEYFGHLENNKYNDTDKDVEGFEHVLTVNMVHVQISKYLLFFKQSFPDFEIESEELIGSNHKITIKTKKSLHDLINYTNLLSIFLVMINDDEYMFVDDSMIERYIRVMNTLNAPYYIRYLFKLKFLTNSPNLFKKHKKALEKSDKEKIHLQYGDTHIQRIDAISSRLSMSKEIIDIGCGEGRYGLYIANKLAEGLCYHAIDTDPTVIEEFKFKANRKGLENILYYNSLDHFIETNGDNDDSVDIICTEVIEHMEIKDAKKFIQQMVMFAASKPVATIIITTPNADFNKHYNLETMRHDDHKWEYGVTDFEMFITETMRTLKCTFNYKFIGIGDSVDGEHVTQGVIIGTIKD